MISKKFFYLLGAGVTCSAILVFVAILISSFVEYPEKELPDSAVASYIQATTTRDVTYIAFPTKLIIPVLSVDAQIQTLGITSKGSMAAPHNYIDVGWYKYGTIPGNIGSAVIDGHVDNGLALPGVFKYLKDLKVGDDVYIVNADNVRLHFMVERIKLYPYDNVPRDILFNAQDNRRLNLITCDGVWVQGEKTYDHRLVVFTKLLPS